MGGGGRGVRMCQRRPLVPVCLPSFCLPYPHKPTHYHQNTSPPPPPPPTTTPPLLRVRLGRVRRPRGMTLATSVPITACRRPAPPPRSATVNPGPHRVRSCTIRCRISRSRPTGRSSQSTAWPATKAGMVMPTGGPRREVDHQCVPSLCRLVGHVGRWAISVSHLSAD